MKNQILQIAESDGRNYITPEDVTQAVSTLGTELTRVALLDCIGNKICGIEDVSLCAFVAWKGTDQ